MPRTTETPFPLAKSDARRIWLRAQRLDRTAPFGDGPQATPAAVAHLGYVQIDTINVIERSHHHILYSRIPGYRREHLHQAQTIDKSVFEYWTHALSYIPTADMRFYVGAMKRHWQRRSVWFTSVTPADLRKVLRRIRTQGALTIRDIDDDVLVDKDHAWASRKPSKRALQLAFYRGLLTVSERSGMLKTYELMTRHFGWERLPKAASESEILNHLLDRALRSQGVVSLDSVCYLDARRKPGVRRLIESRMRRKELVPVELEGAGKLQHWLRPETLDAGVEDAEDLVHILSPFDPLINQRKRLHLVLRLRAPLRGLRAEGEAAVRLLRPPRPGRGRDRRAARSQGRPRAAEAVAAALDLARQALTPIAPETDRRGAAPVRALPARALSTLRCGARDEVPPYSSGSVVKNSG